MKNFEIIIIIFTVLVALLAFADKLRVPNAILLVLAGLSIGFIPSMPAITLDPDVIFMIFLPPILYDAASHTSWHDFKSEIKPISTLAIALVILTTVTVALGSHWLIPGFQWPLAFILGAIVSPPDAVAATNIIRGLGLNRKVITILEGESLINDASALVAYRFAITAIGTGSFVLWKAGMGFLYVAVVGILSGMLVGYVFVMVHKKVQNNSIISTSLTLLTPFITYLCAEHIHASGVLAVVSAGLVVSWRASDVFTYQTRIRNRAVWDTLIFLFNGFIFILIGLQLPSILDNLERYDSRDLILYGFIVSMITILVRMLWVFGAAFYPVTFLRRRPADPADSDTWKNVMIVAWTGTRGVVSLATALALPLTLPDGTLFPQRSLILFLAFVVIFVTLVVQGLSLPLLIRWLRVNRHEGPDNDEVELRLLIATDVVNFIENEFPLTITEPLKKQIQRRYMETIDLLTSEGSHHLPGGAFLPQSPVLQAQSEIHAFQRQLLIKCHKEGAFNQSTIRQLERELDLEELQLNRLIKKKK